MGMALSYQIIRSDRKTIGIQIIPGGSVVVRCPKRMRLDDIRRFVESKSDWIEKHLAGRDVVAPEKLTEQEVKRLREKTMQLVTERVKHYAPMMGVQYHQIVIRTQRTRWGSCSSKGNLSFNCLLGLMPPEVLDYVVVHELCHLIEMNHSKQFWDAVEQMMPDYKVHRKWLKDNGNQLIAKI